ncbi:MAG TPA: acylphosphatase, partial [Burkholderiales bacterium]|nr:acylphosphatase [Burkholderiales bacterium]
MRITRQLRIFGRVQGVWYRESMRMEAERLGVTGWVRNRRDGSVEAVVQGSPAAVDAIVAWARRGPELARVTDVQLSEADGSFSGFEKLHSL